MLPHFDEQTNWQLLTMLVVVVGRYMIRRQQDVMKKPVLSLTMCTVTGASIFFG